MDSIQRELSFRGEFSVITLKGAILTQSVTTLTSWLRSDSKITGCVLNRRGILLLRGGGGRKEGGGGEGDAAALKRKVRASSCRASGFPLARRRPVAQGEGAHERPGALAWRLLGEEGLRRAVGPFKSLSHGL